MLKAIAIALVSVGLVFSVAGAVALNHIVDEAQIENVVTGDDASMPNQLVDDPFTMISQADNIETHTLARTDGLRYSEMARDNEARPMWVTATTLRTALHFGAMAYAFSLFTIVVGALFMLNGVALLVVNKRSNAVACC